MSTETTPPQPPSESSHRRLIGLNIALLMVLGVVTILTSTQVGAQPGAGTGGAGAQPSAGRGRGDYTMLSGRHQGGDSNAVFIMDAVNQQVLALKWNRNKSEFDIIGMRHLIEDSKFNQGR